MRNIAITVVVLHQARALQAPASGRHAEVLAEISQQAEVLVRFVAAEQSGTYDGIGERARVGSDPIENPVRRLAALLEERNGARPS